MTLERATLAARKRAYVYEPRLAKAVTALLRAEMRHGAARVKALDTLHLTEGDVFPHEPDTRRVLLILEAVAESVAGPLLALEGVTAAIQPEPTPEDLLRVSFTASNPLVRRLLDEFGLQITQVTDGERRRIIEAARLAYAEGLSIPNAAASIMESVAATEVRATLIARTMLVGASNGASLAAVRMAGAAATKTWLSTNDGRTRLDHAEANGQTVPTDKPFQIGGYAMQYPGDPAGPPDETCNCRCTLVYSDSATGPEGFPQFAPSLGLAAAGGTLATMAASGSTSLPLSARDAGWDAGAARKRLSPAQYPDAHFWRDPEGDPATLAAYKLPFADVVNGRLTAIWRGVTAGAQRLSQTQIPSGDVAGVQRRMAAYYAKAAKAFDDPSIQPPWSSSAAMLPPNHDYAGTGGPCVMCGMMPNDPMHFAAAVTAAAGPRWTAVLALEGIPTDDNRLFDVGAFDWREPPLTLYAQFENSEGHDDAEVAGRIDAITRIQQGAMAQIIATGVFGSDDAGQRCAQLVMDRSLSGVSVDFAIREAEMVEPMMTDPFEPGMPGMDSESQVDVEPTMRISSATILAATVLGMPAFDGTTIALAASGDGHSTLLVPLHATLTYTHTVVAPAQTAEPSLVASIMQAASEAITGERDRLIQAHRSELERLAAQASNGHASNSEVVAAITAAITATHEPTPVHLHAAPITVEAAPAPSVTVAAAPTPNVTIEPPPPAVVNVAPAQVKVDVHHAEQGARMIVRDSEGNIIGSEPVTADTPPILEAAQ